VTCQYPVLSLPGQLVKYITKALPELTIEHFSQVFWYPHHMVLAIPFRVASTLYAVHQASFLVTLSGPRFWRLLYFTGTVKPWESPGKAGGLPREIKARMKERGMLERKRAMDQGLVRALPPRFSIGPCAE